MPHLSIHLWAQSWHPRGMILWLLRLLTSLVSGFCPYPYLFYRPSLFSTNTDGDWYLGGYSPVGFRKLQLSPPYPALRASVQSPCVLVVVAGADLRHSLLNETTRRRSRVRFTYLLLAPSPLHLLRISLRIHHTTNLPQLELF